METSLGQRFIPVCDSINPNSVVVKKNILCVKLDIVLVCGL